MIFAFFSSLLNAAAGAVGLKTSFGFAAGYESSEQAPPANAQLLLTIKRDGTWTITAGTNDLITAGSPTSGTWHTNPAATVGDGFELLWSDANRVGTPTVTNPCTVYTALTSDRQYIIAKSNNVASADITSNIRAIGTSTPVLTGTFNGSVVGI